MRRLTWLALLFVGCITPRDGQCACVCQWTPGTSGETGRVFVFAFDGGAR